MAKISHSDELEKLREYLRSDSNEDAKRHLLYPLFKKLFKDKFKIESDTHGADIYIEGQLIVEAKSNHSQWLEGFYQALHYHKKFGLSYNTIIVVAHNFIAIWKLNKLPEYATILVHTASAQKAPNVIGKENAKKTSAANKLEIKNSAFYWLEEKDLAGDIFGGAKNLTTESFEVLKILNNLDSDRLLISPHNFINTIERMKPFFEYPIDAVHAFYTIVAFWDITSTAAVNDNSEISVIGFKGNRFSEHIKVAHKHIHEFKKFIEGQYIFTNEGSGLTVDYYFSRFDEVLAKIDPEYVKQHGIFFTDANLSKFALWFAKYHFPGNINENYIVFDPAAGSGNLVSSWRGKLKHKIVSELQPDLLRTIERRMKADPFHIETGFTIVPKTTDNKGLNFLDRPAAEYLAELKKAVKASVNLSIDKPIAFLLNPPYKNTDEKQEKREETESHYAIDPSIIEITGEDAGKERYLAFLGQILNIAKEQDKENHSLKSLVMIFTPTSWLIPRPTYVPFRKTWDKYFKFHSGFIVTSNEWFKLDGKWPLAFTLWAYEHNEEGNENHVKLNDLTLISRPDLNINWNDADEKIDKELNKILKKSKEVTLDNSRGSIKDLLGQKMYDFKRDATKAEIESNKVYGGLPLKDERRNNKKTYGVAESTSIGFMDDATPVRVKGNNEKFAGSLNCVWYRLDSLFQDINKSKCFNGPTDNRSYCAYNLDSAKAIFTWFALTKALNGVYPVWANKSEIWLPNIKKEKEKYWYSLCFAFVLAENRCVVTKFEKDNPVKGAPEVFVDNPLCPTNKESFWCTTLEPFVIASAAKQSPNSKKIASSAALPRNDDLAITLIDKIKELYKVWNTRYCKGQWLQHVGLHDEPYFKYFDYADFLTPHSGLIQIKKYAELEGKSDLQDLFKEITALTKKVKEEIYHLLDRKSVV